jgi:hypothetical protein
MSRIERRLVKAKEVILRKGPNERRKETLLEGTILERIWDPKIGDIVVLSPPWKGWTFCCRCEPNKWFLRNTQPN